MERTLLLNATYEPLQVVSWKRAVRMMFQEKVEVVEEYNREIRSVSLSVRVPSVIRLLHFVRIKRSFNHTRLTRSNLFARDGYRCQYCGEKFPAGELTCDHVTPVARGGAKEWENMVTCCVSCNRRKGDRSPEEAGLRLARRPVAPSSFAAAIQVLVFRVRPPESWKAYIFWET